MIIDTILHEIAHALLPPDEKHSEEWVKLFISMGGSGRASCNINDLQEDKINLIYKIKGTCPKCGESQYFKRKPKNTRVSCGCCSRVFDPQRILIFSNND